MKRNYTNISKSNKKENGEITISMISIVITIAILILLAGVTITALDINGENGIISKAKESRLQSEIAGEKEKIQTAVQGIIGLSYIGKVEENALYNELTNMNENVEVYTSGTTCYITFLDSQRIYLVTKDGEVLSAEGTGFDVGSIMTQNTPYTDPEGNTAIIPAGFCLVKGSVRISDGLVISDVANDDIMNSKGGNQFVWIPVDGENLKYEQDTTTGRDFSYKYYEYTDWKDDNGNLESVSKYKGFYVARFEAGIPEGTLFTNQENDTSYIVTGKNIGNYIPVSKKNTMSWNLINQENAKTVSEKMYANSISVTSSLIDSYAWDTITKWISNSGKNVTNSSDWGNYIDSEFSYSGLCAKHSYIDSKWEIAKQWENTDLIKSGEMTEILTGSSERNFANNIYDFAGNMWEWTTEYGSHGGPSSIYGVLRGGGFYTESNNTAVCQRDGLNRDIYSAVNVGFRVVLYLK